jgi:hypothetical protein
VAIEGFTQLVETFHTARMSTDDPVERLRGIGKGYVSTHTAFPGHCMVLFRSDLIDRTNVEYQALSDRAFSLLLVTVTEIRDQHGALFDPLTAAHLCWSSMHGLVSLSGTMRSSADRRGVDLPDATDLVDCFTTLLLHGLLGGRGET